MITSTETYFERLHRSFNSIYTALELPRIAHGTVFALILINTGLLAYSAYVHSPTLNEPSHLVGGLSHWRFGRFEIYRVNPPFVRMVAAMPVIAVGYKEDWSRFYDGQGARPEADLGEAFVAANGERTLFLLMIARWACIPFSWIGAVVCFLWARDLYGRPAGTAACAIWCFEPNVLAHASLISADAGATSLGLAACYTFWRWLRQPSWGQAAITGIVLGLSELAKTTFILFYPLWPLLWLLYRLPVRHQMKFHDWVREGGMLALRMVIGIYVINMGYGFEGTCQPLKEYRFVSNLFKASGTIAPIKDTVQPVDPDASTVSKPLNSSASTPAFPVPGAPSVNRFANSWLGELPVPLPKNYLIGIDLQQRDFENYGRPSYLRGRWSDRGWWYYYLYAIAIKVPLGLWILGLLAVVSRLSHRHTAGRTVNMAGNGSACPRDPRDGSLTGDSRSRTASWRDTFILLFPAVCIFALVSSKTGFSEHMRYVLPAFPYYFIFISQLARFMRSTQLDVTYRCFCQYPLNILLMPSPRAALLSILGCWFVVSSLWIYPHSLSYFNESIGGPLNGHFHLTNSNIDWGQDLRYLKSWIETGRNNNSLYLAYFGNFDPRQVNVDYRALPPEVRTPSSVDDLKPGCYAISATLLDGYPWSIPEGRGGRAHLKPNELAGFQRMVPSARIGYSIFVFKIKAESPLIPE